MTRSIIHSSAQLLQETVLPAIVAKETLTKVLGHFGKLDSIKLLYQDTKPQLAKILVALETAEEGNSAKIASLYQDFATTHLLTLADGGTLKNYTGFWVKNKKLGRRNLVDYWLTTAGVNIKGKKTADKARILTELGSAEKQKLVGETVEYWVERILPRDLDRLNRKDLKHLELAVKEQPFAQMDESDAKTRMLTIIEDEGIERFESEQKGKKSFLDFWIDTIDGEGAAKDFSTAQKKRRLIEILDSPEDLSRLCQTTLNEAAKTSAQIKKAMEAYQSLIKESELDQASQELLGVYQDNQLFFHVITGAAKNKNSVVHIEASTKTILAELAQEKAAMLQQGRVDVFQPLRDMHYLSLYPSNDNLAQTRIQKFTAVLGNKIKWALSEEVKQIEKKIQFVSKNSETSTVDLEVLWAETRKMIFAESSFWVATCRSYRKASKLERAIDNAWKRLFELDWDVPDGVRRNRQENLDRVQDMYDELFDKVFSTDVENVVSQIDRVLKADDSELLTGFQNWGTSINSRLDAEATRRSQLFEACNVIKSKLKDVESESAAAIIRQLETLDKKLEQRAQDVFSPWMQLVDIAQEHFERVQIGEVLDKSMQYRRIAQRVLDQKPAAEIQQALENRTLNPVQKDLVARYADNPHLKNLLAQPAGKYEEDISILAATEQLNWQLFDSLSERFRKNMTQQTVYQLPQLADIYIHILGFDATQLSGEQKYQFLAKVPSEELELAGHAVRKFVKEKFLVPAMSNAIQNKVRVLDPGHNTAQMVQQLDKVSIQLAGQQRTLNEISSNIDHFIDVYKDTSARMIGIMENGLYEIAKSLESIHADTSSVRNNVKTMLFQSIQNSNNRVYREELKGLMEASEQQEFSQFVRTVAYKKRKFIEEHPTEALYEFVCNEVLPSVLRESPSILFKVLLK